MGKKRLSASENHSTSSEVELNENDISPEVEESNENLSRSALVKKTKKGKKRSLDGESGLPSSDGQLGENNDLDEINEASESQPVSKKAKKGKKRILNNEPSSEVIPDDNDSLEKVEEDSTEDETVEKIKKPLPPGYVCKACGAVDAHAIYDCTLKLSKKKKAAAAKKEIKSENDNTQEDGQQQQDEENVTASYSLFVSGLPFDANKHEFLKFLQSSLSQSKQERDEEENNEVTTVKLTPRDIILLNFTDNPSKCNGLGYINCANEEDFQSILGLNGVKYGKLKLSIVPSSQPKKSKKDLAASFDSRSKADKKKGKLSGEGQKRCYRCGQLHDPKTCANPRICYRCRQNDHISSNCPLKKVK
jgi:hypothetical protein